MSYLTYALMYLGISFAALVILELMYIVVMGLQRAQEAGTLAPWAVTVGTGFMYAGLLWDVICNLFVATAIFLEFPREFTVSARLRRLVKNPDGWRKRLAKWFSVNLLNPFSNNGPHIPIPD